MSVDCFEILQLKKADEKMEIDETRLAKCQSLKLSDGMWGSSHPRFCKFEIFHNKRFFKARNPFWPLGKDKKTAGGQRRKKSEADTLRKGKAANEEPDTLGGETRGRLGCAGSAAHRRWPRRVRKRLG